MVVPCVPVLALFLFGITQTRAQMRPCAVTQQKVPSRHPPRICVKRGVENQIDSPEPGAQVRLTRMRKAIHLLPGSRCDLLGCVNGGHSRFSYFRNRQVS